MDKERKSKRFNVKHNENILLRKMKNDFDGHDESNIYIYEHLSFKCGFYSVEILLEMVFFDTIPICPLPTNARYILIWHAENGFLRCIRITVPFDISENFNKDSNNIRRRRRRKKLKGFLFEFNNWECYCSMQNAQSRILCTVCISG